MISLHPVQAEQKELLWNIHQKYLYEMTQYYPDDVDEAGNYHYGYFEAYFTDPERIAYLIRYHNVVVGFAMLNPCSYVGHQPNHVMAEFTVFPAYRRKHIARQAAEMILARHPGKWEIKFHEMNKGAKSLWEGIAGPYAPAVHHLNDDETVLEFLNG